MGNERINVPIDEHYGRSAIAFRNKKPNYDLRRSERPFMLPFAKN